MLKEVVKFHREQSGLGRKQLSEIAGVSETVIYLDNLLLELLDKWLDDTLSNFSSKLIITKIFF